MGQSSTFKVQQSFQVVFFNRVVKMYLCLCLDADDPFKLTDETRSLGLVVCRGTAVVLVCPADSMESIPNPFVQQQEAL